jgi:hypothetical protein
MLHRAVFNPTNQPMVIAQALVIAFECVAKAARN